MHVSHTLHQGGIGPQMLGYRSRGPARCGGGLGLGNGVKDLSLQGLQPLGLAPQAHGLLMGAHH